jgi:hypothetical protein
MKIFQTYREMPQNLYGYRTSGTEVIASASGFMFQDALKLTIAAPIDKIG